MEGQPYSCILTIPHQRRPRTLQDILKRTRNSTCLYEDVSFHDSVCGGVGGVGLGVLIIVVVINTK